VWAKESFGGCKSKNKQSSGLNWKKKIDQTREPQNSNCTKRNLFTSFKSTKLQKERCITIQMNTAGGVADYTESTFVFFFLYCILLRWSVLAELFRLHCLILFSTIKSPTEWRLIDIDKAFISKLKKWFTILSVNAQCRYLIQTIFNVIYNH
jgi:hypothetical protein